MTSATKKFAVLIIIIMIALIACDEDESEATTDEDSEVVEEEVSEEAAAAEVDSEEGQEESEPMVGGDKDEHGCIGSAGYSWCEAEDSCVQPWKLAEEKGFETKVVDSVEVIDGFDEYCSGES